MYSKSISTNDPALVLFLIDQSGSMGGYWGDTGISKCDLAANALNQTLYDLALRACLKDGEITDRIHVGIISYGDPGVNNLLGADDGWLPATEWCTSYSEVRKVPVSHDGSRVIEKEIPIWVEPRSNNGTPMSEALYVAAGIVSRHSATYSSSHPPIVINITDGEAGGIAQPAANICSCSTEDGAALLFTIQISSDGGHPLLFPAAPPSPASQATQELFKISSVVPEAMASRARRMGIQVPEGAHGIALNADPLALTQLLQVGTTLVDMPDSNLRVEELTEIHV
jgi:hypothetical protein